MTDFLTSKYEELIGKFLEYRKQEAHYKSLKNIMSQAIDQILNAEGILIKKIFVTALNENYDCLYEDKKSKKVDYEKLSDLLSDTLYNSVVKENVTTYLKIAPEKKEKPGKERPPKKEKKIKKTAVPSLFKQLPDTKVECSVRGEEIDLTTVTPIFNNNLKIV
jgi:hypothetical protein